MTDPRAETHALLSKRLQGMPDRELIERLERTGSVAGFGRAHIIELDGVRVFAKSLPLTREEHQQPYRTDNVFQLPAFYHYGLGSAGFGVFRELAAHEKSTRWVLGGDIATFPLLYHHRILPLRGETVSVADDELDEYVAYWHGSEQVRRYMLARRSAEHHVVLFLEYVPHALPTWLPANLDRAELVISEIEHTLAFLREHGIAHFDAHLGNILTDGHHLFLTDFGLALDDDFELDPDERAFLDAHRHFDAAPFIHTLYQPMRDLVSGWSEDTRQAVCARLGDAELGTILRHPDELAEAGILVLPRPYRDASRRYLGVLAITHRVFRALQTSKLDGGYDDDELRRALDRARAG